MPRGPDTRHHVGDPPARKDRHAVSKFAERVSTVEEVDRRAVRSFVTELSVKEGLKNRTIKDNLSADGLCIIGTPNDTATQYASKASQIGHVNMFDADRLTALLRRHFTHVFIFGMNDEVVHTGFYPMCHYLVAVACVPRR